MTRGEGPGWHRESRRHSEAARKGRPTHAPVKTPKRESQYTESYLDACEVEPITVGTYLNRTLKGNAKKYSGKYQNALQRSLDARVEAGDVVEVRSVGGRKAYRRA